MKTSTITLIRETLIARLSKLTNDYQNACLARDKAAEAGDDALHRDYCRRIGEIYLEQEAVRVALEDFLKQDWANVNAFPRKRKIDDAAAREVFAIIEKAREENAR
jgi:hypothetical protein